MLTIGGKALSTFAEPLGVLCDCHRRVEHFLGTLLLVAEQAHGGALSPAHRDALQGALRYFREAAPRHTQDEEVSLFPRLRDLNDPKVQTALAKMAGLEADHRAAQPDHQLVESLGQQWLNQGRLASEQLAQMQAALQRLQAMYHNHIRLEDEEIFPLAGQVLNKAELQRVGQEMAARRGVEFQPKDSCPGADKGQE